MVSSTTVVKKKLKRILTEENPTGKILLGETTSEMRGCGKKCGCVWRKFKLEGIGGIG